MSVPRRVLEIAEDIRAMRIRGAGRIARAAVQALMEAARSSKARTVEGLVRDLDRCAEILLSTRPTAVSLPNGVRYVMSRVLSAAESSGDVEEVRAAAVRAAEEFIRESRMAVKRIGEIGARMVSDGETVMTHCQSSAVFEILKTAVGMGKSLRVVATETRPLYQGRLTARLLSRVGIPVTLIVDGAARYMMPEVDRVLVGADAVAANGALVNKIGTSMIALAAHEASVPFFTAAETYKLSPETMLGELILIEERSPYEVLPEELLKSMRGVSVRNPSFDVTPPEYIDGIITERGVVPPHGVVSLLYEVFGWMKADTLLRYQTYYRR